MKQKNVFNTHNKKKVVGNQLEILKKIIISTVVQNNNAEKRGGENFECNKKGAVGKRGRAARVSY